MSVPPLRLNNNFDSYTSGEVTIHPSAVLALGVILQAAANSKIIIGPGVCIGMGSILQVQEGTLEVQAGASLGAGFLMVGKGTIGANACIGSATTVFNCSVAAGQVVAPGSVVGDTSRQINETNPDVASTNGSTADNAHNQQEENNGVGLGKDKVMSSTNFSSTFVQFKQKSVSSSESSPTPENQSSVEVSTENGASANLEPTPPPTESSNNFGTQIHGQGNIQRLLTTLFPHRQSLNNPISDNQPE